MAQDREPLSVPNTTQGPLNAGKDDSYTPTNLAPIIFRPRVSLQGMLPSTTLNLPMRMPDASSIFCLTLDMSLHPSQGTIPEGMQICLPETYRYVRGMRLPFQNPYLEGLTLLTSLQHIAQS